MAPGADCADRRNEGVGEHVRTRLHLGIRAGEIAEQRIRTERRNLCFFCRTGFGGASPFRNTIQPFDLMSRRHPLSSTGALSWICLSAVRQMALATCRPQATGNPLKARG